MSYRVSDLVCDPDADATFEGGSYATVYLSPADYHRVHAPADMDVTSIVHEPGELWPVNALSVPFVDGLFRRNERVVFEGTLAGGARVAVVMVGATVVGRISVAHPDVPTPRGPTRTTAELEPAWRRARGDELLSKPLLALLFPGGLIFLIAIGFLRPQGLPMWLQPAIGALPYIVLTFGLIFDWYFSSRRIILSLLVLTLADPATTLQTLVGVTTFLVPLNLLAFSIIKEDSLSTLRGVTRIVLVLIQPLLLWLCLPDQLDLASAFTREYIPAQYTDWTPIPQAALCAFAIALLLHFVRFILHRDPLEGGAIWALCAVFTAYHASRYLGWQSANFFMTAG